jgi:hypothetical protein
MTPSAPRWTAIEATSTELQPDYCAESELVMHGFWGTRRTVQAKAASPNLPRDLALLRLALAAPMRERQRELGRVRR